MFNNHLANEAAELQIKQRAQEAETYRLHKQLGYGDHRAARWVLVFIMLITVIALGMLP